MNNTLIIDNAFDEPEHDNIEYREGDTRYTTRVFDIRFGNINEVLKVSSIGTLIVACLPISRAGCES